MLCHGVKQKHVLPALLWWGGFYEQLVRSVNNKHCNKHFAEDIEQDDSKRQKYDSDVGK